MERREPSEVGRLVCLGRWKKPHLVAAQEQFGSEYLADALLSVFTTGELVEGSIADQTRAASMLLSLRPRSATPLHDILRASLPRWNLSAEEFPIYLSEVYGRDALLGALGALESDPDLTAHAVRGIETFRFWLGARRESD